MSLKHDEIVLFVAPDENERGELCTLLESFSNIHEILAAQAKYIDSCQSAPRPVYRQARATRKFHPVIILDVFDLLHLLPGKPNPFPSHLLGEALKILTPLPI